jgi:hypothetical protein
MNIRELNKPINSKTLNETLAKKFGTKINVEQFTLEQLQDARNKIRTKLSDIETNESFAGLPQNEIYSKNKLFLDVLNAAISERADVDVEEKAKPDYLDFDKDGDKKEPMKKALKDKKKKPVGEDQEVDEETREEKKARFKQKRADKRIGDKISKDAEITSPAMQNKKSAKDSLMKMIKKESIVKEGEEDKAELVMAAKDMVDRLTGWMEDTAEMQSESMLELADAIRDEMGAQQSETFTATVKPALEQLYAAMETTRGSLTQGVGMLTGEAEVAEPMGAEPEAAPEADMEPTVDTDEVADDFAAAEAAVGGEDEAGRAKRESINLSRRLGTILSSKK